MQATASSVTVDFSDALVQRVLSHGRTVDRVVPNIMAWAIVNGLGTSRST
jgi:hypothetical protein